MTCSYSTAVEKIRIWHCEKWRYPGLQALRLRVRFLDRPQHIENIVCLAGLKQAVFLVEGKWNTLLPKVAADFHSFGASSGKNIDVSGADPPRTISVTDSDQMVRIEQYVVDRCCNVTPY